MAAKHERAQQRQDSEIRPKEQVQQLTKDAKMGKDKESGNDEIGSIKRLETVRQFVVSFLVREAREIR